MADINAQAGQILGVAQPPVSNNQPKEVNEIQSLTNELKGLTSQREGFVKQLKTLGQGMSDVQGEIGAIKQQQAETQAAGKTSALEQQYEQQQTAQREYKKLLQENPLPAFVPTKDSGMDLAKLMSSMAVMGTLMGRSGSGQSAINAMSAMKGMMTGWQEGRQDLYKKESDQFSKSFNRMIRVHREFRQEMEDAIKLASTNKELSSAKANEAALKLGSPIVMQQINEGNFKAAIESVKAMDKLTVDMEKVVNKQLSDAKKRANDLEVARIRAQGALSAAQIAATGRVGAAQASAAARSATARAKIDAAVARGKQTSNDGRLKPGVRETDAYKSKLILAENVNSLAAQANDPELQALIKNYRVESFLSEEFGKALAQLMTEDIPPKLRRFLTEVRYVRNSYYLDISGKAVTGGEALRNYGVVPQPGDPSAVIADKLNVLADAVDKNIKLTEAIYAFPKIDRKSLDRSKTELKPGETIPEMSTVATEPAASSTSNLPQEAIDQLKEGENTTFKNGQTWTLKNGSPVQVNK
jgi:hypothetical protein